jgi:hypothetical protein
MGMITVFVTLLYWVTHLWNYNGSPWNSNGLFDDAAWDIYFANIHAFRPPYAPAVFDTVGYISREVVFHYYITVFFKLFGYNLLVFNVSLLVLGFITVLFTVLVIQAIFRRPVVTFLSAVTLNFFPLHFTQIFMGHRYAIVAPLMMVSYYFLYTSWVSRSRVRAAVSGVFAALCTGSAIMGRQYLYGLVIAGVCFLFVPGIREKIRQNARIIAVWLAAFAVTSAPLVSYVVWHWPVYFVREQGLGADFIHAVLANGIRGITPYATQIAELFFSPHSYRRQFLTDFTVIPLPYILLLLPGFFFAWKRKRYEVVWLSLVPVAGAFISGAYDFRVLMAVPFWVITIAMSVDRVLSIRKLYVRKVFLFITSLVMAAGLVPAFGYLWRIDHDPNAIYLLPHTDVAVSRLVQDIAAGEANPSSAMKRNEFNRRDTRATYDLLVAPYSSYAIMHLYLQHYEDKKILAFTNGGIQLLKTPEELFRDNRAAIAGYKEHGKDLLLLWQVSPTSQPVIRFFSEFRMLGGERTVSDTVDGRTFSLYMLTISKQNITGFQRDVVARAPVWYTERGVVYEP